MNKKVFSLAMFYYDLKKLGKSYDEIKSNLSWANKCNGKIAKRSYDGNFYVGPYVLEERWCKLLWKI